MLLKHDASAPALDIVCKPPLKSGSFKEESIGSMAAAGVRKKNTPMRVLQEVWVARGL